MSNNKTDFELHDNASDKSKNIHKDVNDIHNEESFVDDTDDSEEIDVYGIPEDELTTISNYESADELSSQGHNIMNEQKSNFETLEETVNTDFVDEPKDDIKDVNESKKDNGYADNIDGEEEVNIYDISEDELTTISIEKHMDEDDAIEDDVDIEKEKQELPKQFWLSPTFIILLLVIIIGGIQVYDLIYSAFEKSTFEGLFLLVGLSIVLLLIIISVFRELKSVWKLKNTYKCREQYKKLLQEGNTQDAITFCKNIYTNSDSTNSLESFLKKVSPNSSVKDVIDLYEQDILSPLDKKARDIIVKRSRETAVVVAASPLAWLDMAYTLARSIRMIREIAEVYGYQCGLIGRLALYRRVIRNVTFIGIADLGTDAIADAFIGSVSGMFLGAAAQGLTAGIFSSRLGYMTIKTIRPLPISRDKIALFNLVGEIKKLLKDLRDKSKKKTEKKQTDKANLT